MAKRSRKTARPGPATGCDCELDHETPSRAATPTEAGRSSDTSAAWAALLQATARPQPGVDLSNALRSSLFQRVDVARFVLTPIGSGQGSLMSERGAKWSLEEGMNRSGMTWDNLWLRQLSVGGAIGELEVEAYVLGVLEPDAYQHDLIAQAINEYFLDNGEDHPVAYWSRIANKDEQPRLTD